MAGSSLTRKETCPRSPAGRGEPLQREKIQVCRHMGQRWVEHHLWYIFQHLPYKGEPDSWACRWKGKPWSSSAPVRAGVIPSVGQAQSVWVGGPGCSGRWVPLKHPHPGSDPTPSGRPHVCPEWHSAVPSSKRMGPDFAEHLLCAQGHHQGVSMVSDGE